MLNDGGKRKPFDVDNLDQNEIDRLTRQILDKFSRWKTLRYIDFRQYVINISLYVGRQWYGWDSTTARLVEIPKIRQWHSQAAINRIQPKCRSAVSRLTSNLPMPDVAPASGDYSDEYGARAAVALLKWNHREQRLQKKYRNLALWTVVCGHAWLKDEWDVDSGATKQNYAQQPKLEPMLDEMGQPALDDMGEPAMTEAVDEFTGEPILEDVLDEMGQKVVESVMKEGATRTSVIGPVQMYYDTDYSEWEDVIDCIERNFKPLDWIREHIPNCEDVVQEQGIGMDDAYQMMYQTIADGTSSSTNSKQSAAVLEYWMKSTIEFPKGLHVIMVNDKIRVIEEMPGLEGDRLPYSHTRCIPIPGSLRGQGFPELLYDNQMAYNKAFNQNLDNAQLMLNKKYLVHKQTTMDDPDDTAGQVMQWEGPYEPRELTILGLPQGHQQIMIQGEKNFDDLTMIHKISEGGSSPEINSEDQVSAITENDHKSSEPMIEEFLEAISMSCKNRLIYYQTFGPDEMILKIVGADGKVSLKPFRLSDIKNNTDVYLTPSSMMTSSRSARMREIQGLAQSALIEVMSPEERKAFTGLVMRHLHYAENEQALNELTVEETYAERENQKMANGEMAYVLPFDNHDVHIQVVLMRMKSAEFEDYPNPIKDLFWQHYQMHQQAKMEILEQVPQMMGEREGALPGKSEGQGPGEEQKGGDFGGQEHPE